MSAISYPSFAIPRSAATWSSPRIKACGIGMPSRLRASRVAWLRSPGTVIRSTPGILSELRKSRTSASTLALKAATSPKAAMLIAAIAWPVLVTLSSSCRVMSAQLPAPVRIQDIIVVHQGAEHGWRRDAGEPR